MEGMFGKHPRFTSMPTLHGGATVLQSRIRRRLPREYLLLGFRNRIALPGSDKWSKLAYYTYQLKLCPSCIV
jgi:hypothetical protein